MRLSAQGHKASTANFVALGLSSAQPQPDARVGYTVTKKIGNAVVRNRIKRRLREAVRATAEGAALPGWDYVFIARKNALLCDWPTLLRDVRYALRKISKHAAPAAPAEIV